MTFSLHIKDANGNLKFAATYPTYADAVVAGQDLGGYGRFFVDTGNAAPARWQQLLQTEPVAHRHRIRTIPHRIQQILDSL